MASLHVKDASAIAPVEMAAGIFRKTLVYNDDAMLCFFDLKKDAIIELHSHPAAQLGYVISGKAEFWYETKENKKVVGPGNSYIIPGGTIHGVKLLEDTTLVECFSPSRSEYED